MAELFNELGALFSRGGYVMYPLVLLSIASVTLVIERTVFWVSVNGRASLRRIARLNRALRDGNRDTVAELIEGDTTPYGRLARRLFFEGVTDAVAAEAVEDERGRLDRYMVSLSTIITAAPLLGILGTVLGIIQSFELLGSKSTLTDPTAVAGGIAAALLTTAFGLVVALVTLFPYMAFRGQVGHALGRIEAMVAAAQEGMAASNEESSQ
ncbi:MAG: MotA/TolQ/ExbB proton channel family protein [Phycisphaerales bacterium]|nr:MotA/TolQ/ExbB proton channel family protein [Phycisphaerales bacterium]